MCCKFNNLVLLGRIFDWSGHVNPDRLTTMVNIKFHMRQEDDIICIHIQAYNLNRHIKQGTKYIPHWDSQTKRVDANNKKGKSIPILLQYGSCDIQPSLRSIC